MRPLSKFLHSLTKEVNGPSDYPAGGFVVDIGELSKIKSASGRYVGNGNYLAKIITPAQDSTLKPNQVKIQVLTNITASYTINEGGTATVNVVVGNEVAAGTDLSGELFVIEATGY